MTTDTHRSNNNWREGHPGPKGSAFHSFKAKCDLLSCIEERSVAALEDWFWDQDEDGQAVAEDIVSTLLEVQSVTGDGNTGHNTLAMLACSQRHVKRLEDEVEYVREELAKLQPNPVKQRLDMLAAAAEEDGNE